MNNNEEWRAITGYEGWYEVSSFGKVRSLPRIIQSNKPSAAVPFQNRKGRLLKPGYSGNKKHPEWQYERVTLNKQANVYAELVHRLVAFVFIPNPDKLPCVNHKDGNKLNNHVSNLEWVTYSQNVQHQYDVLGRVGARTGKTGAACPASKPVNQFALSGEFIKRHDSGTCAAKAMTGAIHPGWIRAAIRKKAPAYGFLWEEALE